MLAVLRRSHGLWLGLLLPIFGCVPSAEGEADGEAGARHAREAADPAHAAPILLTDDIGHTVRLDRPARRVVSLVPTLTELILALGAGDRLIARTDYDLDPSLAQLPSAGGGLTPSLEWLAALGPELVLAWPDQASRGVVQRMEALDITVYNARLEQIPDTYRALAALGRLLGLEGAADSLANALSTELEAVRAATTGRRRPAVLYLVDVSPPRTPSAGTFIHELITVAGGRNLFEDLPAGWPEVSLEAIVQRRPELIVVARGESGGNAPLPLSSLPGWRDLDAVHDGRVVEVDAWTFNRSGANLGRVARALAELFHPDAAMAPATPLPGTAAP